MMQILNLFLCFLEIGLFSIGGGYVAIPLIRSQTVDVYGWLTADEFMNLATIAEMTPGPIAINGATFVGMNDLAHASLFLLIDHFLKNIFPRI